MPLLSVTVPSEVEPSKNCTVPVATDGDTVAVNVTNCPEVEGFTDEASVVVVDARVCRLIWAVLLRLPEIPVIVTLTVPVVAVALAVSVSVLVVVVLVGLNDAVTPVGSPEADKLTMPLKPFCGFTVMVIGPLLAPSRMVTVVGDADRLKFGVDVGQWLTKLAALMLPIPVAKSHPVLVP